MADLITAEQFGKEFGWSKQTLQRMRSEGTGPRFVYVGRRIFYDRADIAEWVEQHKKTRTSEN